MSCGNIPVCIEKSAPLGIIIPSVQIIETRYCVIIVTPVTKRVLVQCRQRLCCQVLCRYLAPCVIYVFCCIFLFLFFVPVRKTGREILFAACFLYQIENACLNFECSQYVYMLPATCYAPAVKHSRCGTTAFVKSLPKPSPKQYAY